MKEESLNTRDNQNVQADSLFYQGELHTNQSDPVKALIYFKAAERVARSVALHDTVLSCLLKQIRIYITIQDTDSSIAKAREGLAYSRLLRRTAEELQFLLLQIKSLRYAGKLDEAAALAFEGIELSVETNMTENESLFVMELAEISLARGEFREAIAQTASLLRRAELYNDTRQIKALTRLANRISAALDE